MHAFRHRLDHYAKLPESVWRNLENTPHRLRQYARQHPLVRAGDRVTDIHILQKGFAIRKRHLENGKRQILNFIVPGDVFDLQALVDTESDHAIETLSICETRIMARDDFMHSVTRHPDFISAMWWSAVQEEALLREHLVLLGQRSAIERVSHLLIELRRRLILAGVCHPDESLSLPVTRQQIADTLGLTPVHVSRTISRLRQMGLISNGKTIELLDPESLASVSGFEQAHLHLGARPFPEHWLKRASA